MAPAPACGDVSGEATSPDRWYARRAAKISLIHNIDAGRDFFAAQGLHHVREQSRQTRCSPYVLFEGFTKCVVTARLCGR